MPLPLVAPIMGGALLGGGSSLLGGGKSGQDAGNVFQERGSLDRPAWLNQVNQAAFTNDSNTLGKATNDLQTNPILSQLFGQGGAMQRAGTEEQNLANRGYSLQNEDHEAYGQASGNIARMFGQSEQSLAQSLADRGMSQSGIAGQEFSGLLGNKQEQLAGLQTQIAQNRMKMNMERLNQTRNFLSQMGSQAQSGINQIQDAQNQRGQNQYNMGMGYLNALQGANERAKGLQQASEKEGPNAGSFLRGALGGGMAGGQLGGALSGSGGGGFGSTGAAGGGMSSMVEPGRRVLV